MTTPKADDHEGWLERFRATARAYSDEELIASVQHELSNSGWVVLKSYYLQALREELVARGLTDTPALRELDRRVIPVN